MGLSNKQITPCGATSIEITHYILLNCSSHFTETKSAHCRRRRKRTADWLKHVEVLKYTWLKYTHAYLHWVRHCSTYPPKQKLLRRQQYESAKYHAIQTTLILTYHLSSPNATADKFNTVWSRALTDRQPETSLLRTYNNLRKRQRQICLTTNTFKALYQHWTSTMWNNHFTRLTTWNTWFWLVNLYYTVLSSYIT